MSLRGLHYGKLNVGSQELQLVSLNDHKVLGLAFKDMNNVTVNKNDIIIENTADEVGNDDCLCEVRFYVDEPKEENDDDEKEEGKEQEEKETYASKTYKQIKQRAKIGEFAGESIATLIDVNLAVPRGKYTVDFYKKNFRLHGASYSYNVDYKHVMKAFILPMVNEAQVSIVLQLNKDKPLYQGQTVYRYIVIQVKKQLEVEIKSRVNPEMIEEHPNLKELKPEYNGYLFKVFVDLIQVCSKIAVITPGDNFKSRDGQPCLKCNVKAQPGWLYLMKQSMIFISKPVIYFKTDEIRNVELTRTSATSKQFDMKIVLKDDKKGVQFMNIQRPELDALLQYFRERSVKVEMEAEQLPNKNKIIAEAIGLNEDDDDESDDEDFDGEAGSGSDDDDDDEDEDESFSEEKSEEQSKKKKGKGKQEEK